MRVGMETETLPPTVEGSREEARESRRELRALRRRKLPAAVRIVLRLAYILAGASVRAVDRRYCQLLRRRMDKGGKVEAAWEYRIIHQGWA